MIFMLTIWCPVHKRAEAGKTFLETTKNPLPDFIKKWQIFGVVDGKDGMKAYELIYVERGKSDEFLSHVTKALIPFTKIEGYTWKIEPLLTVKDLLKNWFI